MMTHRPDRRNPRHRDRSRTVRALAAELCTAPAAVEPSAREDAFEDGADDVLGQAGGAGRPGRYHSTIELTVPEISRAATAGSTSART